MKRILIINLQPTEKKIRDTNKLFEKVFYKKAKIFIKNLKEKDDIKKLIKKGKIDGIILTGSQLRIKKYNKGIIPKEVFKSKIPILGLCYGFQYLIYYYSSLNNIKSFKSKNYNKYDKKLKIEKPFKVEKTLYRFNHHDYITNVPKKWKISIKYKNIIYMAYDNKKNIGIQFHPEKYNKSARLFYSMWLKYI